MSWSVLAYMTLIFALRNSACATVMFANWAASMALWLIAGEAVPVLAFMALDFVTAAILAGLIATKLGKILCLFNWALFVLHGLVFQLGSPAPEWHVDLIDWIAWAQIIVLALGVWGDGLVELVDRAARRHWKRRSGLVDLADMARVEKGKKA